jgi:hypothetical protein
MLNTRQETGARGEEHDVTSRATVALGGMSELKINVIVMLGGGGLGP